MRRVEWWTVRVYGDLRKKKIDYDLWGDYDSERKARAAAAKGDLLRVVKVTMDFFPAKKKRS